MHGDARRADGGDTDALEVAEHTVLTVLGHLERIGVAAVRAPRIPVHPLG